MKKILFFLFAINLLTSCVTQKEYSKALDDYLNEAIINKNLLQKIDSLSAANLLNIQTFTDKINALKNDTASLQNTISEQKTQMAEMEDKFQSAQINFMHQLQQSSTTNQKTNADLLQMQLNLEKQKLDLDNKQASLKKLTDDLQLREQRIQELEKLLQDQNAKTIALQHAIQNALSGFTTSDLIVNTKDGKVYVSMSENLLFKSASIKVEAKGEEALGKLAEVIQKNPDLSIMIEGHTDNVAIKSNGACIRDNWDLSLMRSSSVLHILTEKFKVNPTQIIASGRGEFYPAASNATPEGKAQNRRTEIILSPNLDKINALLKDGK